MGHSLKNRCVVTRVGSGVEDTEALSSALRVTHHTMHIILSLLSLILSVDKED